MFLYSNLANLANSCLNEVASNLPFLQCDHWSHWRKVLPFSVCPRSCLMDNQIATSSYSFSHLLECLHSFSSKVTLLILHVLFSAARMSCRAEQEFLCGVELIIENLVETRCWTNEKELFSQIIQCHYWDSKIGYRSYTNGGDTVLMTGPRPVRFRTKIDILDQAHWIPRISHYFPFQDTLM